ncbi:LysM peptidoglycan-binding domain-containing protein [Halomonas stenophila]|uniref:Murein DD-endopeptidase MepM/ murein hydrolase activator NlpD n=1 Tax=Halomonas stenophila TaxID=795312 RepID=A0A7W5ESS1_9GAMM|nr:LysM peptidoglycan-binding domain-containing protein [Halomonas stenophila]MBB3229981.1 murein DD-endopeptidase MepM/ murein hydrolase activator NlpD [Halomonas stenophila]
MAQRPVAGQGRRPRLALILLILLLAGCAGTPTGALRGGEPLAGNWITIQRGDTLGGIARRAEVPLVRLRRFNPGVDPRRLAVGQRLLVPSRRERAPSDGPYRYQVRPGDTYTAIARRFGTAPGRVAAANPGIAATDLEVGQLIQVPLGGDRGMATPAPARPSRARLPDPGEVPRQASGWPWPLDDYRVARRYGPDARGTLQPMLLATGEGTRARAVADGQVRFAGSMRQLGRVVIVHHPDNLQSVYALCETLLVESGKEVRRGTPLCEVGLHAASGRHELLFDMRHGGKPIDPTTVLR